MIRRIDLTGVTDADYRTLVPRADFDVEHAVEKVRPISEAVAAEGETALRRFSEQFDGVVPESLRVDPATMARCLEELDPTLREAFEVSIERRRAVCKLGETEDGSRRVAVADGATITTRIVPVDRVGLYVPGGLAPLASSVIMNVVPAQEAGVGSIAIA